MLDIYQELSRLTAQGGRAVLATVILSHGSAPRESGAKMLIREDGTFIGSIGGGAVEKLVREKATQVMNSGEAQLAHFDLSGKKKESIMICGGQMDVFLEPISSPETLYLFGAGHISQSTALMGKLLGFRVVVTDPRAEFNNRDRFPSADSLIVEQYDNAFSQLRVSHDSYIIIYTTGHAFDEVCLRFAISTEARYIGMIGSKKKVSEVKEHLIKLGAPKERLDAVHAPIGLKIGAETPEEIAISILAEVIKVKRGQEK
ncbi:XdhC family protein [Chloroflexota bacterium]